MTLGAICHRKFVRHLLRRSRVQFQKIMFRQALSFERCPLTFPCKFNHTLCFSSLLKVDISGITGPVQFDENGIRIVSRLEILNLRNDSFKRVSSMKGMNNPILFSAFLIQTEFFENERQSLHWISTTKNIRKDS